MPVANINDVNFDEIVSSNYLVMVDVYAPWCKPCQAIMPLMDQLAAEYDGKIIIGKLNIDESPDSVLKYQVTNIPTFLFFKDGQLDDRVKGSTARSILERRIHNLL